MNCPSADKLSQYADQLLPHAEQQELSQHVASCASCQQIVALFKGEEQFIKETLQEPALPDDFEADVLAQLVPYKKKRTRWRKGAAAVAVALLSFGIVTAVSPSFADFVASIFSTEHVDTGLNEAQKFGFVEQVDVAATDQNITIHIEEVMVDATRIVFIYKVTDDKGNALSPLIGHWEEQLDLQFQTKSGERFESTGGRRMLLEQQIGYVEVTTPAVQEDVTLHWHVKEIDGQQGNWQLALPIPVEKALAARKTVDLDTTYTQSNVRVTFDEATFTPSTTVITYQTEFTEEVTDAVTAFYMPQVNIAYTLEDARGTILASNYVYGQYFDEVNRSLSGQGSGLDNALFSWEWEEIFSSVQATQPVLHVIGFEKNVVVDEQVTFTVNELDDSTALYYEGEPVYVRSVEPVTNRSWQLKWPFVTESHATELTLHYDQEKIVDQFEVWYLKDARGKSYMLGQREENRLLVHEEIDLSEPLTLHLIAAKKFEPLETPLRIPLYEE